MFHQVNNLISSLWSTDQQVNSRYLSPEVWENKNVATLHMYHFTELHTFLKETPWSAPLIQRKKTKVLEKLSVQTSTVSWWLGLAFWVHQWPSILPKVPRYALSHCLIQPDQIRQRVPKAKEKVTASKEPGCSSSFIYLVSVRKINFILLYLFISERCLKTYVLYTNKNKQKRALLVPVQLLRLIYFGRFFHSWVLFAYISIKCMLVCFLRMT